MSVSIIQICCNNVSNLSHDLIQWLPDRLSLGGLDRLSECRSHRWDSWGNLCGGSLRGIISALDKYWISKDIDETPQDSFFMLVIPDLSQLGEDVKP